MHTPNSTQKQQTGWRPCYLPSQALFSRVYESLQRAFSGRRWRELKRPIRDQNVRVVVAFPAGSGRPTPCAHPGRATERKVGQGVVIENRGGAGGNTVRARSPKAEPNGYASGHHQRLLCQSEFDGQRRLSPRDRIQDGDHGRDHPQHQRRQQTVSERPSSRNSGRRRRKFSYGIRGRAPRHTYPPKRFSSAGQGRHSTRALPGAAPLLNALSVGISPWPGWPCRRRSSSSRTVKSRRSP